MTQVDGPQPLTAQNLPVLVRIRRRNAVLRSLILLPFVLVGLFHLVVMGWYIGPLYTITIVSALFTVAFAIPCAYFFFIAVQRPVALRMDAHGISGFYADPASWSEISSIAAIDAQKSHRFLGFGLHDPVGFRDRQTPWRRYKSWASGKSTGHHILVPQALLHDADVDALAEKARALHAAHDKVT